MTARRLRVGFILTVVAGLAALSAAVPAQGRWATYSNPRFGTTADYPADLFAVQLREHSLRVTARVLLQLRAVRRAREIRAAVVRLCRRHLSPRDRLSYLA